MSASCPTNSVPSSFDSLPTGQTYGVIPGQNASSPWMVSCCSPNTPQIVNNCWAWCEIPKSITQGSHDSSKISDDFGLCLSNNGRKFNESNGLLVHVASPATTTHVSVSNVLVTALLALTVSGSLAMGI